MEKIIDIVEIKKLVNKKILMFYVDKGLIYCRNTCTDEVVLVGKTFKMGNEKIPVEEIPIKIDIPISIDPKINPDKVFESLATIDAGSISRTRGMYHE